MRTYICAGGGGAAKVTFFLGFVTVFAGGRAGATGSSVAGATGSSSAAGATTSVSFLRGRRTDFGMPCLARQTGDSLRDGAILRVDRVRRAGPSTCAGAVTGAPTFFRCTGAVAGAFFRRFVASRSALAGVASSSGL